MRPNIRYSLFNLLNVWDYTDREARFKDDNGIVWTIDGYVREVESMLREKDRVLVYCLFVEDTKHLARKLSCGCIYAAEPNRVIPLARGSRSMPSVLPAAQRLIVHWLRCAWTNGLPLYGMALRAF